MIFECPGGQPYDGGAIEMIVAPMTLREWRRHERAALRQREMRRFRRHPIIVAQRQIGYVLRPPLTPRICPVM